MPTANIYSSEAELKDSIVIVAPLLRELLARELTCGERTLQPNEISVRLIPQCGAAMIAPIEIEITAHAYGDRSSRADQICLLIRECVRKLVPSATDIRVWLLLVDLGHSWEE
jgi:hypothetical protein